MSDQKHKGLYSSLADFPDYIFYDDGRVFSKLSRRFMAPTRMGAYVGLQLRTSTGTRRKEYLHRLIAAAFRGPCPAGMQCRHLDGNKHNNSAANLAWGTASENNQDKVAHGTAAYGSKNAMAVLTETAVEQMRVVRAESGASYAKIASAFNVSTMTAYRAVTRQSWSHK